MEDSTKCGEDMAKSEPMHTGYPVMQPTENKGGGSFRMLNTLTT